MGKDAVILGSSGRGRRQSSRPSFGVPTLGGLIMMMWWVSKSYGILPCKMPKKYGPETPESWLMGEAVLSPDLWVLILPWTKTSGFDHLLTKLVRISDQPTIRCCFKKQQMEPPKKRWKTDLAAIATHILPVFCGWNTHEKKSCFGHRSNQTHQVRRPTSKRCVEPPGTSKIPWGFPYFQGGTPLGSGWFNMVNND